jgi:uncharacterized membrane protein YphA (DoxX/SURF4 family)
MTTNITTIGLWILRILAAVIMLQTLFFKFTGAEESVYIFSRLGLEPWGRIGTGVFELIASLLILYPRTTHIGAVLAIGLMGGAIWFHLTKLGIEVQGDKGQLFIYALLVFVSAVILAFIYRAEYVSIFKTLIDKNQA